ncbi:MAG: hypothetical protein ACJARD_001665 [Alphaproteobacteria bacterium]
MNILLSDTGAISLRSDDTQDTIWATQKQMAQLFNIDVPTINEHIKSVFPVMNY